MLSLLLKLLLLPFRLVLWVVGLIAKGVIMGTCGCITAVVLLLLAIVAVVVYLVFFL